MIETAITYGIEIKEPRIMRYFKILSDWTISEVVDGFRRHEKYHDPAFGGVYPTPSHIVFQITESPKTRKYKVIR